MAKKEEKTEAMAKADKRFEDRVNAEVEKRLKAMAKAKDDAEAKKAKADKTPLQALTEDWEDDVKRVQISPYVTEVGRMRGNLKPSDQVKSKEILRRYGFRV